MNTETIRILLPIFPSFLLVLGIVTQRYDSIIMSVIGFGLITYFHFKIIDYKYIHKQPFRQNDI